MSVGKNILEKRSNLWLSVSGGTKSTHWMAQPLRIDYPGAVYHVMNRSWHGNPSFAIRPIKLEGKSVVG